MWSERRITRQTIKDALSDLEKKQDRLAEKQVYADNRFGRNEESFQSLKNECDSKWAELHVLNQAHKKHLAAKARERLRAEFPEWKRAMPDKERLHSRAMIMLTPHYRNNKNFSRLCTLCTTAMLGTDPIAAWNRTRDRLKLDGALTIIPEEENGVWHSGEERRNWKINNMLPDEIERALDMAANLEA